MSRLPLPDPATLPEANRAAFTNPEWGDMAKQTAALGKAYVPLVDLWMAAYMHGILPARLRQLTLMRTAFLSNCSYELVGEKAATEAAGFTGESFDALFGSLPSAHLSDAENAAAVLVDDVVANVKASDAVFDEAVALLGPDQVRELLLIVGLYMFYGRFCANLGLER